jgi:hypothetical protein
MVMIRLKNNTIQLKFSENNPQIMLSEEKIIISAAAK